MIAATRKNFEEQFARMEERLNGLASEPTGEKIITILDRHEKESLVSTPPKLEHMEQSRDHIHWALNHLGQRLTGAIELLVRRIVMVEAFLVAKFGEDFGGELNGEDSDGESD